jgi:NAD(P)-dependent dehydrogenase (short-subunit alcohol dehydrogenase family)
MMKHVVITGGTKGIGEALALEFLKLGCSVCITGRNPETLQRATGSLIEKSGNPSVKGVVCDVTSLDDLERLWTSAFEERPVDIWINNAGMNHMNHLFHELDTRHLSKVIDTNINGTMMGSMVALKGMLEQGYGALYNMEGFGSNGRIMKGMSIYGTSKCAVHYFTKTLIHEYRRHPVIIGSISPGMVVTDMLLEPLRMEPEKNLRALKVFHTLADPADRVTPWLAKRILTNGKHGAHIAWLTTGKISWRFFTGMMRKRKVKGLPGY